METVFILDFVQKRRHNASASGSPYVDNEYFVSVVPAIEMIIDSAVVECHRFIN